MSEFNIDNIYKVIELLEKSNFQNRIEMILLTEILGYDAIYQLEYKEKKYLCIPHKNWNLFLREIEPKSFCNHDYMSYLCGTYAGIPICENDALVVEIMTDILNNFYENKNIGWAFNDQGLLEEIKNKFNFYTNLE